jgi:hypothetical protein
MLPSHVTSLPLSLALREAGYKQEATFFRWLRPEGPELTPVQKFAEQDGFILTDTNYSFPEGWEHCIAPLASEILDNMNDPHDQKIIVFKVITGDGGYGAMLGSLTGNHGKLFPKKEYTETADTLPNALASLWLHIHSQKII